MSHIPISAKYLVPEYYQDRHLLVNMADNKHAELIAQIEQIRSENPDSPPFTHCRIGGDFTPIPSSRELELHSLPQIEDIISSIVNCF